RAPLAQRKEFARISRRDGDAWQRFQRDVKKVAASVEAGLLHQPADPMARRFGRVKEFSNLAHQAVSHSAGQLFEQSKFWTLSMDELLSDYFTSDEIKAHIAAPALLGAAMSPLAPTSASLLVPQWLGHQQSQARGMPDRFTAMGGQLALLKALESVIKAHQGEIRLEAEVTDVRLKDKKANGVVLADGEEIAARVVLSDLDLKRSYLNLFEWSSLPREFVEDVGNFRMEGTVARLNLVLEGTPEFPSLPKGCPAIAGGFRLPGTLAQLDGAFDDWLEKMPPRDLLVDVSMPSLSDPTLTPSGKHVVSANVQYVAGTLNVDEWTPERREALQKQILGKMSIASPSLTNHIVASELLLPGDFEERGGVTQGDLTYGQIGLDQMFFNRPLPNIGHYASPVKHFYVCSASMHPGGMAVGAAGSNAAQAVLQDLKVGESA
ncbi:MAG: NAD(P)/FAD-dependent oxidoreductase, partial [Parvibaculaceae bacterium]|nr:NAD(P)/FAD-dependent oxidoreductase [Parvibaculaceae bacterium]